MGHNMSIALFVYLHDAFIFFGTFSCCYYVVRIRTLIIVGKICGDKRKAVPLQAWSGPEGSRKLRFQDFMTTAQDGGKVVSLTHRPPSSPGNTRGTHFR